VGTSNIGKTYASNIMDMDIIETGENFLDNGLRKAPCAIAIHNPI